MKSLPSPNYAPPPQAAKYKSTGRNYESTTYGRDHLQLYRDIRNAEITRILRDCNSECKPLRVLEVGCGTGMVLEHLISLPEQHNVFGLDGSETMLEQARQRFENRQRTPELSLGSADALPYPSETFDVVIATRFIHLFQHDHKKRIYEEFQRVLRKGGIAIVEYYSRPFAWYRYHFSAIKKSKSKASFFSHYPTRKQVRDIVRGSFERRPIRLVGSRVVFNLLGATLLRNLTRHVPCPSRNPLVDEYLVVTRK